MVCWWVLMVSVAAGSAFAEAKSPPDAGQQARIECAAGNYQVGIRLLAELWVTTRKTVWIYNQARCYEQNNQNDLAISRFREYLRVDTSLSPEDVNAVKKRIEELQPAGAQPSPQTAPSAPAQSVSPGPPASLAIASPPPERSLTSTPSMPPEPTTPVYKRWWFWTGAGAVVAGGVVTAILLSAKSAPKSPNCSVGALCATQN